MRRTKEDAARTREAILDAALVCFNRHGLSQATLDDIACAARVTRGAVYWHFKGKPQILHALRERLSLPFLDRAATELLHASEQRALDRIEQFLLTIFVDLKSEPRKEQAAALMHFKCEYVDDLADELGGMVDKTRVLVRAFEAAYRQAKSERTLRAGTPRAAALETVVFMTGLVRLWLLDPSTGGFRKLAPELIRAHVRGMSRG